MSEVPTAAHRKKEGATLVTTTRTGQNLLMQVEGPEEYRIDDILQETGDRDLSLIPLLQKVQSTLGYLPRQVMSQVSERLSVPLHQVLGVATFYSQFRLMPLGRHVIQVCDGTACHVRGSRKIVEALERELGTEAGGTTPDGRISFDVVYCLGCCSISPAVMINGESVGHMTPEKMLRAIATLE
jgi:NADH-quinone oxidoreductase subunit E